MNSNKDNLVAFLKEASMPAQSQRTTLKLETQQFKIEVEVQGAFKPLETEKILTACINSTIKSSKSSAK